MPRLPHLCHPIRTYYLVILAVAAAVTAGGAYLASKLKIDTDLAALLPDSFESVQALKRMEGEVGGTSQLRLALKSGDFDAAVRLADRLSEALLESEYVGSVDYQNDVEFYESHALLFLDVEELDSLYDAVQRAIDKEKQAVNPFMVDDLFGPPPGEAAGGGDDLAEWEEKYAGELPTRYYVNADSTVLVLSVNPADAGANLDYSRRMVADVRRVIASVEPTSFAPDMEVYYGGNIKNRVDELEAITRDVLGTAGLGVTGVFLLLVVFYRRLVIPILLSVILMGSMAWTFGLTFLLIGQLNTITAFLFVVLFVIFVEVRVRPTGATDPDGDHEVLAILVCRHHELLVDGGDQLLDLVLGETFADTQCSVGRAVAEVEVYPADGAVVAFDRVGLGARGARDALEAVVSQRLSP